VGHRAWVRHALVLGVVGGDRLRSVCCHVDVGADWRRLLRAPLQTCEIGKTCLTLYCDGRKVVARDGVSEELYPDEPHAPRDFAEGLRAAWRRDYGPDEPLPPGL